MPWGIVEQHLVPHYPKPVEAAGPTLCWFETDRLRMGGVVRHTQHTLGTPLWYSRVVLAIAHGAPAHPRGSRHTNTYLGMPRVSQPLHPQKLRYDTRMESVDIWRRSKPGGKENDPYTHDKIRDPVERCPYPGPYGGARGLRL